jgi:hypothetical protein
MSAPTPTGRVQHEKPLQIDTSMGPDKCCKANLHGHFFVTTDDTSSAPPDSTFITLELCGAAEFAVIEYAFITEEVPGVGTTGNYFGTRFDDFFEVSITAEFEEEAGGDVFGRPVAIDGYVSTANSINGLGLGAFNTKTPASTYCYVLSLDVTRHRERDDITFGFSVENAIDEFFQSAVCGRVYFVDVNGKEVCDHISSK